MNKKLAEVVRKDMLKKKAKENTNTMGAYINRGEGKYAVHASKSGGAIAYFSSLNSAYNYLEKKFGINREDVPYIKD